MKMNDKQFHNIIREIIREELKKLNLLTGQWHLGTVSEILSQKRLKVFVDGSDTAQTIPCNPDITFAVNDEVWVVYINGNPRDKYVISKRAI
jgi:hypothetical protein